MKDSERTMGDHECSICAGLFNIDTEGGTAGYIGILPVSFCPTCHAGIMDYAEQFSSTFEDYDEKNTE